MFKIAFRSLIFWSLLAGTVQAQTISLESFLELVQSNHPFFEKEDILPEIEMKDRESLLGAEDWLITTSAHVARLRPASSSAFTPTAVNALGYRIAAERLFWRTGGRLSAGWTYDFTDQNPPPISLPGIGDIPTGSSSFFHHRIFAQYIHPLLQNKKGKLDKLDYELQEFGINLTRIQAQENKENFLLDVATRFLEWTLVDQQIAIARERRRLAEEQLQQTKQRRAANLIDEVDVLRAEDAVRIAEQTALLLQAQWKARQAELAVIAQSQQMASQSPEYDLYALAKLPDIEAAVTQLQEKSRLLQLIEVQRQQLAHLREGQVEQLKARLDLVLNAGLLQGKDEFSGALLPTREDLSVDGSDSLLCAAQ